MTNGESAIHAGVAQLVEHVVANDKVAGSRPVPCSNMGGLKWKEHILTFKKCLQQKYKLQTNSKFALT